MPKEVVYQDGRKNAVKTEVRWGDIQQGYVQLGVDLNQPFTFVEPGEFNEDGTPYEYTSLHFTFYSREAVDELIRILHKAKRKTFPRGN